MRRRIAQGLIGLAMVLLAVDLVLVLPRLAPFVTSLVRDRPEGLVLAAALLSLVGAKLLRRRPRTEQDGEGR
jgi:hypothetical protein